MYLWHSQDLCSHGLCDYLLVSIFNLCDPVRNLEKLIRKRSAISERDPYTGWGNRVGFNVRCIVAQVTLVVYKVHNGLIVVKENKR